MSSIFDIFILLTKTTAAQNEVALSYHGMRGLHFLAVVFAETINYCMIDFNSSDPSFLILVLDTKMIGRFKKRAH